MTDKLIKPIATAMWLLQKTHLTFKQIAESCGITEEAVSEMENGFSKELLRPHNPVLLGQITMKEIHRCEKHPQETLVLNSSPIHGDIVIKRSKKVYTPASQKNDKISSTLWLIKNTPLDVVQISELLRYPKKTIESIKDGSHIKANDFAPRDPVMLGLCTQVQLNNFIVAKEEEVSKPSRKKKTAKKAKKA